VKHLSRSFTGANEVIHPISALQMALKATVNTRPGDYEVGGISC
jgi:hypothetical protein